ncbi:MAG: hypothetical protein ABSB30_15935 [Terracidiphilus sp.]|jgi:hypothetical protein
MRFVSSFRHHVLLAALLSAPLPISLFAQPAPEAFRWIDFHSASDQGTVTWVTRSLTVENWSAIREIGVEYDAALVVTTTRSSPQTLPAADTFTVWSLSLTNHSYVPLLKGVNLRLLDWLLLDDGHPRELAALYDDCADCQPSTYFTAFHYDMEHHAWTTRWLRGNQTILVWSANIPQGVALTQLYALLTQPNGRSMICTWNHIDHGAQKPEEIVACYDLDPRTGQERMQTFTRTPAQPIKLRICSAQNPIPGLARGQDSPLCQQLQKQHPERKPVTTPPANNHGQSAPPRARH